MESKFKDPAKRKKKMVSHQTQEKDPKKLPVRENRTGIIIKCALESEWDWIINLSNYLTGS